MAFSKELSDYSHLASTERPESIFSIGGICAYNFTSVASLAFSPVLTSQLAIAVLIVVGLAYFVIIKESIKPF